MFFDPSSDDSSFLGSRVLDRLWIVLVVGFPQVQVMRRLCDIDNVDIPVVLDLLGQAAGGPRIELSIRKNDVGDSQEIALDILSTQIVPHPVIPRGHLVLLLAVLSEGIVVKGLGNKHGVGTVGARHSHLIARKHVPSKAIERACAVCVVKVCAVRSC